MNKYIKRIDESMILPGVGGWGKFENSMLKQMQMNATLSQNGYNIQTEKFQPFKQD